MEVACALVQIPGQVEDFINLALGRHLFFPIKHTAVRVLLVQQWATAEAAEWEEPKLEQKGGTSIARVVTAVVAAVQGMAPLRPHPPPPPAKNLLKQQLCFGGRREEPVWGVGRWSAKAHTVCTKRCRRGCWKTAGGEHLHAWLICPRHPARNFTWDQPTASRFPAGSI